MEDKKEGGREKRREEKREKEYKQQKLESECVYPRIKHL
jgi:hypothetical protein